MLCSLQSECYYRGSYLVSVNQCISDIEDDQAAALLDENLLEEAEDLPVIGASQFYRSEAYLEFDSLVKFYLKPIEDLEIDEQRVQMAPRNSRQLAEDMIDSLYDQGPSESRE